MKPTKLKLLLFKNGITQRAIAKEAKCSLTFVNQVVNGKSKASLRVKAALEKFGIDGGESKKAS